MTTVHSVIAGIALFIVATMAFAVAMIFFSSVKTRRDAARDKRREVDTHLHALADRDRANAENSYYG